MRTTVDLDDDILLAAKDLARRENTTLGRAISRLIREALRGSRITNMVERNGVIPFEVRPDAPVLTLETVNRLRDED